MERKESLNGLQLIKFGAIRLRGNFYSLFMGAFAMCMPLILVVGISAVLAMFLNVGWIFTIGLLLFVVCVGPLQVGYIKFFNATIEGKQPKISMVYSQFRFNVKTLKYIYFAGLLFVMYIAGGVLWLVPAGFAISFYSMVLFFEEKFEYARFSEAFNDCSRKMLGNRLAMFSYKLIFYFVYFLLFCVGGLGLALVYTLSIDSMLIAYIATICMMIIFIFMYTMLTVYFHSCNQIFFEDTLMYHERKSEEARRERAEKQRKKELEAQMTSVHLNSKEDAVTKEEGNLNDDKVVEVVNSAEAKTTAEAKETPNKKNKVNKTSRPKSTLSKTKTESKSSKTKSSSKRTSKTTNK